MKTVVLLNHSLTEEQKSDLGGTIFELPPELKKVWGEIPPDVPRFDVTKHLEPILSWITEKNPDRIVCQGDYTAFTLILKRCWLTGMPLLVATSKRETAEEVAADGSVVKKAIFRHIQFREV